MEKKALTWTELRVGLVVIISLFVLTGTILYIGSGGGSPFAKKYEVKALMADVNGLKPGAPVRVGGVEVGTVTEVDFAGRDGGGMVEVTMKLDRRVQDRVTDESQATLGAMGLLGEKAVDISASPRGQPVQPGGYVPAAAQDPFKGLMADASDSTAHLRRILARMDAGEGLIGKALRDDELYQRMIDVSVRLQTMMDKLESQRGPLGRMMNDEAMANSLSSSARGIDAVVTRIESGQGALGALSKDQEMVREMKGITANMAEVSGRLRRGEGSIGKMMTDDALFQRLTDLSARLDALTGKIERGDGSLGRLINDPEFYNNVNGAAKDMRSLISDIRKDPQKYLRVKLSVF
jgi:phospholipid/cholesterol/gamma-HCH transport system substrate-binding protein